MKLALPISSLKILMQATFAATLTLESSAQTISVQTPNNLNAPFSNAEIIEVNKSIEDLKKYLETLKLYNVNTLWGSTHEKRLKSLDWLNRNMADDLVKHGVNKDKLLEIAGNDASVTELLERRVRGEATFEDYFKLAEIAVIARVGDGIPNNSAIYYESSFFKLEVSDTLSANSNVENIAVVNSLNPHHRKLHTGQICVFLLSPTYTKHFIVPEKEYPNLPDYLREDLPDSFLTSRYPTLCSLDGETFGKHDQITRLEILGLTKVTP